MKFIAKVIHVNKVGESHSACASIIPSMKKSKRLQQVLEAKTKQTVKRVEDAEIVEAMVIKQNTLASGSKLS